jgi:predicted ATPase
VAGECAAWTGGSGWGTLRTHGFAGSRASLRLASESWGGRGESLLKSTRQQVHQRIAHVLETHFPDTVETQPELLAYHYTEAGLHKPAVDYWEQAGRRAIERSATVEAVSHLTKGLELLTTLPDTVERTQHELALQVALGPALIATKGQAAPEVEHAYARARVLCQHVGNTPQLSPVLHGLWRFYYVRGNRQTTLELAQQALALAEHVQDPALFMAAHYELGITLFVLGELPSARSHLEQGMSLYNPQQHAAHGLIYGHAPGTGFLTYTAMTLWLLGYPDQALQKSREALTLARELAHPYSLARVHFFVGLLHQLRREGQAVHELSEAAIALCSQQAFALYLTYATMLQGWSLATQGHGETAVLQMRQALDTSQSMAIELLRAYFLALLAEVYGHREQPEDGLTVLAEAFALVERNGECWYEPELHRLKGELLLHAGGRMRRAEGTPEACFHKALELARAQQAKFLELRAATSLARLWQQQNKRQEALDLLVPVYGWFTEGFDTADLREAKGLLHELTR